MAATAVVALPGGAVTDAVDAPKGDGAVTEEATDPV